LNCSAHVGSLNYVTEHAAKVLVDNVNLANSMSATVVAKSPDSIIVNPIANCSYPGNLDVATSNLFDVSKKINRPTKVFCFRQILQNSKYPLANSARRSKTRKNPIKGGDPSWFASRAVSPNYGSHFEFRTKKRDVFITLLLESGFMGFVKVGFYVGEGFFPN
jgi:hypothetical protein